jgi:hypothetical protein
MHTVIFYPIVLHSSLWWNREMSNAADPRFMPALIFRKAYFDIFTQFFMRLFCILTCIIPFLERRVSVRAQAVLIY